MTCIVLCLNRHTIFSAFGLSTLLPLLLHLLRRCVIDVGLALREQLLTQSDDGGEMVTGVGELVWLNLQHGNILQNHLRRTEPSMTLLFPIF